MRITLSRVDDAETTGYSFYDVADDRRVKGILISPKAGDSRIWFEDEVAGRTVAVKHERYGVLGTMVLREDASLDVAIAWRENQIEILKAEVERLKADPEMLLG